MARIIADKKTENNGLIRYANAGYVMEKSLRSGLADAFSQHIPAWKPSATHYFHLSHLGRGAKSRTNLRSKMSDGFSQSPASSLAKGFEKSIAAWLAQAQTCTPLPIRVNSCDPW